MSAPAIPCRMSFTELMDGLRLHSGLLAKRDIQPAAGMFCHQPFPQLGAAGMLGDDAALLPRQNGQLLLACEGMHPGLVEEDLCLTEADCQSKKPAGFCKSIDDDLEVRL